MKLSSTSPDRLDVGRVKIRPRSASRRSESPMSVAPRARRTGPFPEDPTDDRGLLKHPALGERQGLDPGDEHRLDRIRDRRAFAARFDEVADGLLQEVRVALGPGDDAGPQVVAEAHRSGGARPRGRRLVDVERRDLDRRRGPGLP